MKSAIVTITLGDEINRFWSRYCEKNWCDYAAQHDFDLIRLQQPLDISDRAKSRSPSWQKLLILSQEFSSQYEQIVWIDADIVINSRTSPSIVEFVPAEKVGAVVSGAGIHDDLKTIFLEKIRRRIYPFRNDHSHWETDQRLYYKQIGLFPETHDIVQAGVLVSSPNFHQDLFESVYNRDDTVESKNFEQIYLSYEIIEQGFLEPLNSRFNSMLAEQIRIFYPYLMDPHTVRFEVLARNAVDAVYSNSFFLHFAYNSVKFAKYLPF